MNDQAIANPLSRLLLVLVALPGFGSPGVVYAQDATLLQPYQQFLAARSRGDAEAARSFGREALLEAEREYGAESSELVGRLESLGEFYLEVEDFEEAANSFKKALVIMESEYGIDHPELVSILDALARVRWQQADYSAAESLLLRILEIESAVYGPIHADTLTTRRRLRELYVLAESPDDVARVDAELQSAELVTRGLTTRGGDESTPLGSRRYTTKDGFATVRVFYGTNRAQTGESKVSEFYGAGRGDLELGYLDVTIPESHKYGELETSSRWSIFSFGLGQDALKKKYVLLLNIEPLEEDNFHDQLRKHIQESPANDVFVFVHGYNSSFSDAARRAAQLAYDLDFDGTPVMYSWPSKGSTAAYTIDEGVIRTSGRKMARFLTGVVEQSGADRIHLIAHSMGNRALIEALNVFAANRGAAERGTVFNQVVFAAPDVDRDYFVDVVGGIEPLAEQVTLYVSDNDIALQSSAVLHGAPRAGLGGSSVVSLQGLHTIDMSNVKADILGHSYFAANEGAIYDLFRLFWKGEPPPKRCGRQDEARTDMQVWLFDTESCSGGEVLQAGIISKRFGQRARELVKRQLAKLTGDEDDTAKEEWSRILNRLETQLEPGGD